MNVWFTSDLHIGHTPVATHRGFDDPVVHDVALAARWDDRVREDDVVWVAGDISSGTNRAQFAALDWMRQRPGRKHLITGNHDGPHPMHRDSHKWFPSYLSAFDSIQMAARRRIAGREVLLNHFPYEADRTGTEPRCTQWRLRDEGMLLLHGHIHSHAQVVGHEIHIGLDAWDLAPVTLAEIEQLVLGIEIARAG